MQAYAQRIHRHTTPPLLGCAPRSGAPPGAEKVARGRWGAGRSFHRRRNATARGFGCTACLAELLPAPARSRCATYASAACWASCVQPGLRTSLAHSLTRSHARSLAPYLPPSLRGGGRRVARAQWAEACVAQCGVGDRHGTHFSCRGSRPATRRPQPPPPAAVGLARRVRFGVRAHAVPIRVRARALRRWGGWADEVHRPAPPTRAAPPLVISHRGTEARQRQGTRA